MLKQILHLCLIAAVSGSFLFLSCPAAIPNEPGHDDVESPVGLYDADAPLDTKADASAFDDGKMKYIILNDSGTLQSQLTERNTIYEIKSVFDLGESGGSATIPDGCILKFSGGCLRNGTITGNDTIIEAPLYQIFDNCTLKGFNQPLHSRWWCVLDGRDNTAALQCAFNSVGSMGTLILDRGYHLVHETITVPDNCIQIIGDHENGMYPTSDIVFDTTSGTCLFVTRHASLPTITISGIGIFGKTNSNEKTTEGKFGYYPETTAIDVTNNSLSPNIHMSNCRIEHFAYIIKTNPNSYYNSFNSCRFFYFGKALFGFHANNLSIVDCRITNGYQFLYLASGDGQTTIDKCSIENLTGRIIETGTSIGKLTLSNSYIELAEPSERFIYGNIKNLSLTNNEIQNNGCWRTIEITAPITMILQGNHWRFDKNHNNFSNGAIITDHETRGNLQVFVWMDSFQNMPSSSGFSSTYTPLTTLRSAGNNSMSYGCDPVSGNQVQLIP